MRHCLSIGRLSRNEQRVPKRGRFLSLRMNPRSVSLPPILFIRMKEVLCGRGRALVLPATAAGETQHVHGGMSLPLSAA